MTSLTLMNNRITTLVDLPHLPALRQLSAGQNRLTSVASLSDWTHLEHLYLRGNLIDDLETLQPLIDVGVYIDIWPY